MSQNNLYKGFEVELFTGSLNSHIGVSAEIEKKFPDFLIQTQYLYILLKPRIQVQNLLDQFHENIPVRYFVGLQNADMVHRP